MQTLHAQQSSQACFLLDRGRTLALELQAPTCFQSVFKNQETPFTMGRQGSWANGRGLPSGPVASGGPRLMRGVWACTQRVFEQTGHWVLHPGTGPVEAGSHSLSALPVGEGLGLALAS